MNRISIQYHTALIDLLLPLIHLDRIDQESYDDLRALVVRHARAGLQLLVQYRDIFSTSYLSPLQLLCLVQLCDAFLRYDSAGETAQTIEFCFMCLEDAKPVYPVAAPLEKMFRNSLAEYNLPVPHELDELISRSAHLGPMELLDACTRTTYRQPFSQILPNLHGKAAQDFMARRQYLASQLRPSDEGFRPRSGTADSRKRMEIGSVLNP